MKVLYFGKSSIIGPTSRYRIFQFLPYLEAESIRCTVCPLFGKTYWDILEMRSSVFRLLAKVLYVPIRFARRVWDLATIGDPDLVVVEGQLFPYLPSFAEWLLLKCGYTVIIEIDDAIYLTWGHRQKIPALLGMASAVITGNEVLATFARQYSKRVSVIPTVVDTTRFTPSNLEWPLALRLERKRLTVVWTGLAYNLEYLSLVAPVLRELQEEGLITFKVVCSRPANLAGLECDFKRWELDREVETLQDCDIGIMPLPSSEWTAGKCGLKLLQYMAVGMAAVASPVGVNREIISDGKTGFLASSESDWREKLRRLCEDSALRSRMGHAARNRVEERYSLCQWGSRLARLYKELAHDELTVGREDTVFTR